MKKLYYEIPTVEVIDVKVEGGFQLSGGQAGGFTATDRYDMEETDE